MVVESIEASKGTDGIVFVAHGLVSILEVETVTGRMSKGNEHSNRRSRHVFIISPVLKDVSDPQRMPTQLGSSKALIGYINEA